MTRLLCRVTGGGTTRPPTAVAFFVDLTNSGGTFEGMPRRQLDVDSSLPVPVTEPYAVPTQSPIRLASGSALTNLPRG